MSEKEKNKGKQSCLAGLLKYVLVNIAIAICTIAVLVLFGPQVAYLWESIYGRFNVDCADLPEAVEWTGTLSFDSSSESSIPITAENAAQLSRLNSTRNYNEPQHSGSIMHPEHDYILGLPGVENGSDNFTPLIVCSSAGELVQFLSASSYDSVFSSDGRFFAAGNRHERQIDIFNAATFELYRSIPHEGMFAEFAFHPNEPLLALTTYFRGHQAFELWNYETEERLAEFRLERAGVNFLAFNEDGTLLLMVMVYGNRSSNVWGIPSE